MAALPTDVTVVLTQQRSLLWTNKTGWYDLEDEMVTASVTTPCSVPSDRYGVGMLHTKVETEHGAYLGHAPCLV